MEPYNKKWYNSLKRSPYSPPPIIFSIVWPILYISMFVAAYIVWKTKKCGKTWCFPIILFATHLIFNLSWTTLFFKWKKPVWAFIDIILLLVLLAYTITYFYQYNKTAAYIMIPYLLWICFATYLNGYIIWKN